MKVERRRLALAGLLRSRPDGLTRAQIQQALSPVGAYQGSRDTVRKQLRRDRQALRDLGLAVEWSSQTGLYSLHETSRAPRPIVLTPEEAALLREAAALVTEDGAQPFGPDVIGALERLEAYDLPGQEPILVHHPSRDPERVSAAVKLLSESCWRRHPVRFQYVSERGGSRTARRLEPWGLFSKHGHWYVVGRDRDAEARRCFRVSHMSELKSDGQHDGPRFDVPDSFDVGHAANTREWDWEVHQPVEVVLEVDEEVAPLVCRQLRGQHTDHGICRTVTNVDALWSFVIEWSPRVRVLAPTGFAEELRTFFSDIAVRHGGG